MGVPDASCSGVPVAVVLSVSTLALSMGHTHSRCTLVWLSVELVPSWVFVPVALGCRASRRGKSSPREKLAAVVLVEGKASLSLSLSLYISRRGQLPLNIRLGKLGKDGEGWVKLLWASH